MAPLEAAGVAGVDRARCLTMPSLDQFVVWIVVGLLGGSLAGLIITWDRKGFRPCRRAGRRFHLPHAWAAARARQIRDLVARCRGRRRLIAARAHGRLVLAAVQDLAVNFKEQACPAGP